MRKIVFHEKTLEVDLRCLKIVQVTFLAIDVYEVMMSEIDYCHLFHGSS